MDILQGYLDRNGCKIIEGKEATDTYIANKEMFETICGSNIYDTLDNYMSDEDEDDNVIKLIILNGEGNPTSVFYGTIEDGHLSSDYTCSSKLPKGGILLRFYALLLANKINPVITTLTGGISGGIPAIEETDSKEVEIEKRERLQNYHINNGANIEGNKFTYNLPTVKEKIVEIFGKRGGKKRKRNNSKRKTRKLRKRTRRYKHLK